jgi:hypothetical protein
MELAVAPGECRYFSSNLYINMIFGTARCLELFAGAIYIFSVEAKS